MPRFRVGVRPRILPLRAIRGPGEALRGRPPGARSRYRGKPGRGSRPLRRALPARARRAFPPRAPEAGCIRFPGAPGPPPRGGPSRAQGADARRGRETGKRPPCLRRYRPRPCRASFPTRGNRRPLRRKPRTPRRLPVPARRSYRISLPTSRRSRWRRPKGSRRLQAPSPLRRRAWAPIGFRRRSSRRLRCGGPSTRRQPGRGHAPAAPAFPRRRSCGRGRPRSPRQARHHTPCRS